MGGQGSGTSRSVIVHDEFEIEREIYSKSFREFVAPAFEVLEAGDAFAEGVREGRYKSTYTHGWHIDAMADHLQAVADAQIRFLLVNIPPGTMKSVLTSVLWPTWMWARQRRDERSQLVYPLASHRFMFSSYAEDFTKRDTRKAKILLQSAWYRERFPHVVLKDAPDTMTEHHNTLGGERHGASTNSGVTGKHVHGIVEDDPLKAQDAQSARAREEAWFYRTQVLGSRLLPEAGWRVVVMQRLHEQDPSGMILEQAQGSGGEYVHLNLPMEYESARKCITYGKSPAINGGLVAGAFFQDPREEEGELLWPQRMGPTFVAEKKSPVTGLGELGYAGQYQQRPAPAGGSIIQRSWLRFYKSIDLQKILEQATLAQSWDLIFDGDGKGSFVVGQIWAQVASNHYFLHQYRERVDFPGTVRAFIAMHKAWPLALHKRVEKKANGAALIAILRLKVPGIVAWPPKGTPMQSKPARLTAVAPLFEAGNVWAPDPVEQPWVSSWVEEVVGMSELGSTTANDDQCDTTTQYLSDKHAGAMDDLTGWAVSLEKAGTQESHWRDFG
jgi:predicted phage terminase large subunit-like protein